MPRIFAPSHNHPDILINTISVENYFEIDNALSRIKETPSGSSLLKQIDDNCKNGKRVQIYATANTLSHTIPELTVRQSENNRHRLGGLLSEEMLARELAVKKGKFKASGTSAKVIYNQFFESVAYSQGHTQTEMTSEDDNDSTLFHELVHAMRILKGTYTNDMSPKGYEDEMLRAIGVMQYENEPISENKFREQTGLQLRSFYEVTTNVNNTNMTRRPGIMTPD